MFNTIDYSAKESINFPIQINVYLKNQIIFVKQGKPVLMITLPLHDLLCYNLVISLQYL